MIAELVTRGARRMLSGISAPDQWLIDWFTGGEETSSGEHISEENALNVPSLKAAVAFLSEAFSVADLEICQRVGPDKTQVIRDHELSDLLNRQPNLETSGSCWWDAMQNAHGLWGNCYAEIQTRLRGNSIAGLWNRSSKPARTKPVRNNSDGQIYYECHDQNGRLEGFVPAANMLHPRYMSLDGILGRSPVRMIRESIGGSRAAERFANEVFKNGDASAGYFTHPGKLSEPAYARLKKSLGEDAGHSKRHGKKILEEGMSFSETSYKPSDLQLIEVRQYLDEVIARAYNIAPELLHILQRGRRPLSDALRELATLTLQFWGKRWTSEIDSKLLKPPFFCRWNFNAFLFGDRQAQAMEHRTNFAVGKMSINEMRHERGDNRLDDPNADEHFVPLNMVPLSLANEFAKAVIAKQNTPTSNPTGGDHSESNPKMPPGGGDGVTPGEPNGQPGGKPDGGTAPDSSAGLALLEVESIIQETIQRMERIEANEITRAAKEPNTFSASLDRFYPAHSARMRAALERPIRTLILLRDGEMAGTLTAQIELENTINEHISGKRESLLTAAECQASELPARVAELIETWK
jgi:HK97 family phage portal protein